MTTLTFMKPLVAACALALAASPALAQMDDQEAAHPAADEFPSELANGLKVTEADGTSTDVTFTEDGSYTATDGSNGVWTLSSGFLCMTMEDGATGCTSLPDEVAAGDSWTKTSSDGSKIVYSIPEIESGAEDSAMDDETNTFETQIDMPGGKGGGAVN